MSISSSELKLSEKVNKDNYAINHYQQIIYHKVEI